MIARENIKWIILFITIIIFTIFAGSVIYVKIEDSQYNYYFIDVKDTTMENIIIKIENGRNNIIIKTNECGIGKDKIFLNKRKWKTDNIWTFKFTIMVNDIIISEEVLHFPGDKIGASSAKGGIETYIEIDYKENKYNVKYNKYFPI